MSNSLCGSLFIVQLLTSSSAVAADAVVNTALLVPSATGVYTFNFSIPSTVTVANGYKYHLFPYDGANNTNNM
jgi:hypothetical protein